MEVFREVTRTRGRRGLNGSNVRHTERSRIGRDLQQLLLCCRTGRRDEGRHWVDLSQPSR